MASQILQLTDIVWVGEPDMASLKSGNYCPIAIAAYLSIVAHLAIIAHLAIVAHLA